MDNDYERGHSYADIRREIEEGPKLPLLSAAFWWCVVVALVVAGGWLLEHRL